MKKLKLYFAHGFRDRKLMREIQYFLEKYYNLNIVNPFYDNNRNDIERIDAAASGNIQCGSYTKRECEDVRDTDLLLIDECDGVLAIILKPEYGVELYIGTLKEMCYAKSKGKIVYLVCYDEYIRRHLWNRAESDESFENLTLFAGWLIVNGFHKYLKNKILKLKDLKISNLDEIKFTGEDEGK